MNFPQLPQSYCFRSRNIISILGSSRVHSVTSVIGRACAPVSSSKAPDIASLILLESRFVFRRFKCFKVELCFFIVTITFFKVHSLCCTMFNRILSLFSCVFRRSKLVESAAWWFKPVPRGPMVYGQFLRRCRLL